MARLKSCLHYLACQCDLPGITIMAIQLDRALEGILHALGICTGIH